MLTPNSRSLVVLTLALLFAASSVALAIPARTAPLDFTLRTADGGEISSEMLRGDVVVLAFGPSWLGSLSRKQVEGVQELANEFGERNVRVYWVSTDSDSPKSKNYATDAQLRDFAKKNGLKVAVLRDPDGALFKQVGVPGNQLPAVVILDRQGNISGTPMGGLDPSRKLLDVLSPRLNKMLGENDEQ
ncbi:MAG TPA: TlpA disulfide reductase family protein [Pyrinomonadaceae bacterium]|nr:TlpA disulfide reductase family protein [Pyrinomonadaceae bacterium]